jgi:hypothetical protein
MTWQTRAVRFISVGEPSARFRDLVLDFDDDGEPVETILWLPNGGGKSSMIALMSAAVLPAARDFTGAGRQDGGQKRPRRLDDYVATGDTSHTVVEWTQPEDSSLLDERRHLLTGAVYEWPDRRRPVDDQNASLKKLWWSAVPVPGLLDLRTLPVRYEKLQTLTQFHAHMRDLNAEHPELQYQFATSQADWEGHLGKLGVDTSLYRYQTRMNRSEGGVVDVFKFNTVKDFIDLVVDVIARPEQGEDCGKIVTGHARNLFRRPALQTERTFLTEARNLLVELDAAHELVQAATAARDQTHANALRLRQALNLAADEHNAAATIAARRAGTLQERADDLINQQRDIEGVRAELLFHAADAEHEAAGQALAAAQAAEQAARLEAGAWAVAAALAEAATHDQAATELREQLKPERAAREVLRLRVDTVAIAAKTLLEGQAADLTRQAGQAAVTAKQARTRAADIDAAIKVTRGEATEHERAHAAAEARIRDHERNITAARRDHLLEPSESPADAASRLQATADAVEATAATHDENETSHREDAAKAAAKVVTASGEHAQLQSDLAAANSDEQNLRGAHDALATDERLIALAEADNNVNVWGDARRLRAALAEQIADAEAEVLREAVNSAEDDRLVAGVDATGLMPPPAATTAVARTLTAAGVPAETSWHHLTTTYPEQSRSRVPADRPDIVTGVVVQNGAARERALVLLSTDPTLSHITLVTADEVRDAVAGTSGAPALPSVPLHEGLHQVAAASAAADVLRTSGDGRHNRRSNLRASAATDQGLLDRLAAFLDTWPAADSLTRASRVTSGALEAAERKHGEVARHVQARIEHDKAAAAARTLSREASLKAAELRRQQARAETLATAESQVAEHRDTVRAARTALDEAAARITQLDEERARAVEAGSSADLQRASRERDASDSRSSSERIQILDPASPPDMAAVVAAQADGLTRTVSAYEAGMAQWRAESGASVLEAKLDAEEAAALLARGRANRAVASSGADQDKVRALADERARNNTAAQCDAEAATARGQVEEAVATKTNAEGNLTRLVDLLATAASNRTRARTRDVQVDFTTIEDARSRAAELLAQVTDLTTLSDAAVRDSVVAHQDAKDKEQLADNLRDQGVRLPGAPLEGVAASRADLTDVVPFPGTLAAARDAAALSVQRLADTAAELLSATGERAGYTTKAVKLSGSPAYTNVTLTLRDRLGDTDEAGLGAKAAAYVAEVDTRMLSIEALLSQISDDERRIADVVGGHVKELLSGLTAAARASVLPEGLGEVSGEQFLQLRHDPVTDEELTSRVTQEITALLSDARGDMKSLPSGQHLLRQCVHAAVGVKGFRVKVLKPNEHMLVQRVDVVAVGRFSDGEKLTTCILLFCAFARMRQHGKPSGTTGTLMLDNPIGKASAAPLVRLQLAAARAQRVHLVVATGLDDMGALLQFRNIVRLRNRKPLRSSDGYVQLEADAGGTSTRIGEVSGVHVTRPSVPVPAVLVTPPGDSIQPAPSQAGGEAWTEPVADSPIAG